MENSARQTLASNPIDPFVRYFFDNLQGNGKSYLNSLINCNEILDVLARLVDSLVDCPNQQYFKGRLTTLLAEKTLDLAGKHDKKRQLDELKESLAKLNAAIAEEKKSYEHGLIFKKKEIDYKRKYEENQRFYETKANEYHKQIKLLESLLSEVGFNDNLKQESIASLTEENNQLRESLKELNEKLSIFNFPPDRPSLQTAIEKLQAEVDSMNDLDKIIVDV